jgi:TolB-like protein
MQEPAALRPPQHMGPETIVAALERVLDSTVFRRARRSREFLAYVVTETLAGRGDRLSERTVGRRALGRGADFDGAASASVRVRASRVRTALEGYYAGEGRDDPVRILLPAGGYVPRFEPQQRDRPVPRTVPGVAVLTLVASGRPPAGPLAAALSDTLTRRLAHHPAVRVIGPTALAGDVRGAADDLGVSSVLDGRVTVRDTHVQVSVRLRSTDSGEVLWSAEDVLEMGNLDTIETEDRWAREIAARLGDVTGLVVRQEMATASAGDGEPELQARLAFYSYVDRGTADSVTHAASLLDDVLARGRRTPTLLAMRAALANAAATYGIAEAATQLDLAAMLAREALTLDGSNAHAHLVLGAVARERGQWDLAVTHAETAVRLAPHHPSYLVGAGITISGCGEWDRGGALIREGHRLHPGLAGHTHAWLAIGRLVHADHARALAEASLLPSDGGYVWGPLYRAMALAGLGHVDQAHAEADRAREIRPDILDDPGGYFAGRMRLTDAEQAHLVALVDAASRRRTEPAAR